MVTPRLYLPSPARLARVAVAAAAAIAFASSAHAATGTISVIAGYDYSSPTYVANTYFTVVNSTDSVLSGITFRSVGDGSTSTSDAALWTWTGLSLAAGVSTTLYFGASGTTVTGTGYGFTRDYEYTLEGNDQTYTFSAALAGVGSETATFSPTTNATGTFVAFLGNDALGNSLPTAASGTVASISVVTAAVPEPETAALLLAGLGLVSALARRREKQG